MVYKCPEEEEAFLVSRGIRWELLVLAIRRHISRSKLRSSSRYYMFVHMVYTNISYYMCTYIYAVHEWTSIYDHVLHTHGGLTSLT